MKAERAFAIAGPRALSRPVYRLVPLFVYSRSNRGATPEGVAAAIDEMRTQVTMIKCVDVCK